MSDLTPNVPAHLGRYFALGRAHLEAGDAPVAAFFSIVAIEEAAKVLVPKSAIMSVPRPLVLPIRLHR